MTFDPDAELEHEEAHIMRSERPSFLGRGGPASIRYNNPGAMWPGPSSRKFDAIGKQRLNDGLGQGNRIAIFLNAIDGAAALFDLLDRVYTRMIVRDAIRKWSGGNHVSSYLAVLRDRGGIDPDEMITKDKLRDQEWALRFAKAMAWHEAGKEYPLTDDHWRQAHRLAFHLAPSEKPAKDVISKTSSKYRATNKAKTAAAAAAVTSGSLSVANDVLGQAHTFTTHIQGFMGQWGLPLLVGLGFTAYVIFDWLQKRQEQDYDEGRYEPSGGEG